MSSTKARIYSLVFILLNTLVLLVFINFGFIWKSPDLVRDGFFPRAFLDHIDRCYQTFYPSTYDAGARGWTAVVGDSYGAGSGDEFLTGSKSYGIFPKLKAETGKDYLIFARAGYANVNSARELVNCRKLFSGSLIFPNIGDPGKIVFLFYEGNDLNGNLRHAEKNRRDGESIEDFVGREVSSFDGKRSFETYVPFLGLLDNSIRSLPKALGFQRDRPDSGPGDETDGFNRIVVAGEEHRIPDPQGAALELVGRFDEPLDIFYASVRALQRTFPGVQVDIVYIPSVVTCYRWAGDIRIQTYHTDDTVIANVDLNEAASRQMRDAIATFANGNDIGFIDPTEALKAAAASRMIHGPMDWAHFNAAGYQVVADAIRAAGD